MGEWETYHALRRTVLFEARGLVGVYDASHPDETAEGHHPLLLFHRGEAIGVIRVDVKGDEAIFRRVAVRPDRQRKGHGQTMLTLAERFAAAKGCRIVRSSVDRDAVEFYVRCGYSAAGEGRSQDRTAGISMWKALIDTAARSSHPGLTRQ